MYSVAYIDDEKIIIEKVKTFFNKYSKEKNTQFLIDCFTNPLSFNINKKYDCIFLDIEMKQMDGLSLADKIREKDKEVTIVFVTNLSNLAIEGYRVNAFDFLVKPIEYNFFAIKLDRIIKHISSQKNKNNFVTIDTTDGTYNVELNDILLVESDKHYLNIYLLDNRILRSYGKLEDFKNNLNSNLFGLSGKSYLVNFNKIIKYSGNDVFLVNKKIVPITRSYKESFINAFTVYSTSEL